VGATNCVCDSCAKFGKLVIVTDPLQNLNNNSCKGWLDPMQSYVMLKLGFGLGLVRVKVKTGIRVRGYCVGLG